MSSVLASWCAKERAACSRGFFTVYGKVFDMGRYTSSGTSIGSAAVAWSESGQRKYGNIIHFLAFFLSLRRGDFN
jgi:hypothetical protein